VSIDAVADVAIGVTSIMELTNSMVIEIISR
jgi:hypothetical protein